MGNPSMSCCTLASALAIDRFSVAVVCHDAGAANLLAHWICGETVRSARCCMAGPALEIWSRRFPGFACLSLEDACRNANLVITGTGWSSELEHDARRLARANGSWSIAVLDHWVNYRSRFERRGTEVLPDEVWVSDEWARSAAQDALPGMSVRQFPNEYLRSLVSEVHGHGSSHPVSRGVVRALYVCEPLRAPWCLGRPNPEFECLGLLDRLAERIAPGRRMELIVRPHPSEHPSKYVGWSPRHIASWRLDSQSGLARQIADAEIVAGCESYAMAIAVAAGRTVFCSLPAAAPGCRLPHSQIRMLRDLEDGR